MAKPFRITIFDTETTGLPLHESVDLKQQPNILEFGCIILDEDYNEVSSYERLINPHVPITAEITKINGIDNDMIEDAPRFGEVVHEIIEIMSTADVWICHNYAFDSTMLRLELKRLGMTDFPWPKYPVCTANLYERRFGKRPRLQNLYEQITGKKYKQTHRALDDCRLLAEIVRKEKLAEPYKRLLS
jgi:DNA polymerase III epsilon subunit-like protein